MLVKLFGLAVLTALVGLVAGCSGINTGTSVSPATFLLPGIMKADPASPGATPTLSSESVIEVAQVR